MANETASLLLTEAIATVAAPPPAPPAHASFESIAIVKQRFGMQSAIEIGICTTHASAL